MRLHRRPLRRAALALAITGAVLSLPLSAQQTLDRTKVPPPGKPPVLRVPVWTRASLANGADLVVSEKHDLPLVSFSITFLGGADQFEKADRRGVASLTAAMMSEGTRTRDGEALSNALQLLGGNVSTSVGGESGSIGFVSTDASGGGGLAVSYSAPGTTVGDFDGGGVFSLGTVAPA